MARHDWYRNESWSDEIALDFYQRLKRARHQKAQYLRIQALYLTESYPEVALQLLEQYFALGDKFDLVQAHIQKAQALKVLDDITGAIGSFEDALACEQIRPNAVTDAYLGFACLVVDARLSLLYGRALELLNTHRGRSVFPIQKYRAYGARALLLQELGDTAGAVVAAEQAMAAAQMTHSGFRYHASAGLVTRKDGEFERRIALLVQKAN